MIFSHNTTLALLIALGVSAAGNLGLGWAVVSQRDAKIEAIQETKRVTGERDSALDAGEKCSASVEKLQTLAANRLTEANRARAAAKKLAQDKDKRSDKILTAPAAVPGDDCKSAQVRVDGWLAERDRP